MTVEKNEMETGTMFGRLKPAFPMLYLFVFVHAVVIMFLEYVSGDAPPIVEGFVGHSNKAAALIIINIFAFTLCIYNVTYYARLEFIEHCHKVERAVEPFVAIIEFALRFALISVVALKVIRYEALGGLFLFSALICFLLTCWLLYLRWSKIVAVAQGELAPNLSIVLLSLLALFFSTVPARQVDNAVWLLVVLVISSIVLVASVIYLSARFGKDLVGVLRDFMLDWRINEHR